VACAAVLLTGCSFGGPEDPTARTYEYDYRAFDTSGTTVVAGELVISFGDEEIAADCEVHCVRYQLSGTSNLRVTGERSSVGLQDGESDVTGSILETGEVYLHLTPDQVNGVTLRGTFEAGEFELLQGRWDNCSIACHSDGTFIATRRIGS
jgi:hypothetical protein